MSPAHDRVRASTAPDVQSDLDAQRLADVADLVGAPSERITRRIEELDAEWDAERVLATNASSLILLGVLLSLVHSRRWLVVPVVVPAFLLQHAVQGWCPPLGLIRRLGVRTRGEIDAERTALKALRGDFDQVSPDRSDPTGAARNALRAAVRR